MCAGGWEGNPISLHIWALTSLLQQGKRELLERQGWKSQGNKDPLGCWWIFILDGLFSTGIAIPSSLPQQAILRKPSSSSLLQSFLPMFSLQLPLGSGPSNQKALPLMCCRDLVRNTLLLKVSVVRNKIWVCFSLFLLFFFFNFQSVWTDTIGKIQLK